MTPRERRLVGAVPGFIAAALFLSFLLQTSLCLAEEGKWSGVDETVVGKFAKEHGRGTRPPLIDTDRGDLLLFLFLLAGAVGGFVAGYYWRTLLDERNKAQEREKGRTP